MPASDVIRQHQMTQEDFPILDQTVHGKRMPQGYVTSLALKSAHRRQAKLWGKADQALSNGNADPIADLCEQFEIDLVVLRKSFVVKRKRRLLNREFIWQPFRFVRADLVGMRQRGHYVERQETRQRLQRRIEALSEKLGPPELEDEFMPQ